MVVGGSSQRLWGVGEGGGGLSVSSGPSDSSLGAGGGDAAVATVEGAVSTAASDRRVPLRAPRRARCGPRARCGRGGPATGAAPGSWRAAALAASSKCLEVVLVEAAWGYCSVCGHCRS